MKIGMMMLTFNRLEFTKIVLENYFKTTKIEHQMYVWDNHSIDGTRKWLDQVAKKKYPIKLILSKQNVGVPDAIRGYFNLKYSRDCELIGKIDNDILVCDNWLENFVEAFRRVPKLAIAGAYNQVNPPKKWKDFNGVLLAPARQGMQGSLWLMRRSIYKKFPLVENGYFGNWVYFGRLASQRKQLVAYRKKVHFLTDRRQWGGTSPFPDIDYSKYYAQIARYRSTKHRGLPK